MPRVRLINIDRKRPHVALATCLQTTFDQGVLLAIEVHPGGRDSRIGQVNQWRARLAVSVRAQAQNGQANAAVLELLSGALGIAITDCSIVNGLASRRKTIRFDNTEEATLIEAFTNLVEGT